MHDTVLIQACFKLIKALYEIERPDDLESRLYENPMLGLLLLETHYRFREKFSSEHAPYIYPDSRRIRIYFAFEDDVYAKYEILLSDLETEIQKLSEGFELSFSAHPVLR